MRVRDLTDKEFGRLVVHRRAGSNRRGPQWLCECECGNRAVVSSDNLLRGRTRSCGCLQQELRRALGQRRGAETHGKSGTHAYHSYAATKGRCTNPRHPEFARYGGRGIKFLYASFEQFFADLGEPPKGTRLARIDRDGNYEPGNCRWGTPAARPRNLEQQIQRAVIQHLAARGVRGIFYFHPFSGGYRRRVEAAIYKGLGAIAGLPDIIVVKNGQTFGLELKSDTGQLSLAQLECHERLRTAGCIVGVAVGIDAALQWLEQHELLRGRAS